MNTPIGNPQKEMESQTLTLSDLTKSGLTSKEAFIRHFPEPFLVAEVGHVTSALPMFATLATQPLDEQGELHRWIAYPVEKSDRNGFLQMITLGRAGNNDVVLPEPSVSKFHAFLRKDDNGVWAIQDGGSRYGTSVDGEQVSVTQALALSSGQLISLGTGVSLRFFESEALFDRLAALRAVGKL